MMDVPEGWEDVSLAALAQGGLFTDGDWVESKDQDPSGSVRLTQLADVGEGEFRDRSDRWLNDEQAARLNVTLLHPNDLLIARMPDPLARCCMVPESIGRAVTVVDVAVLRINRPDVLPRYVMWAINGPTFRARALELSSGTTRKRISRKNLAQMTIPLPPLTEQRRIVGILEGHLSRLDSSTSSLSLSARRVDAMRRKAIVSLLAEEGEVAELTDLLTQSIGGLWGTVPGESEIDVRVIRVTEMGRLGELTVATAATRSITTAQYLSRALSGGDLLLEKSGGGPATPVGRVGLVRDLGEPTICSNFMHLMRPDTRRVHPRWLHLYLNAYHLSGRTNSMQKASTNIRNIKASDYLKIPIRVPTLDRQTELIDATEVWLDGAARLAETLDANLRRGSDLRRSLLASAFSGLLTKETALV